MVNAFIPSRIQLTRLLISFSLLALAGHSNGEVYKWTDAQGKVHYSDKKIAESAQAQDLNLGTMPPAKPVTKLTPRSYESAQPPLYLLTNEPSFEQATALSAKSNFAFFYFGGDCVSPTSLGYNEYLKRYKESLPEPYELYRSLGETLRKYNYRNLGSHQKKQAADEDGNPPLALHLEIADMRINACAPRLTKPGISGSMDNFKSREFEKSNVWIQLRWTISRSTDDVVLLNTTSEGSVNNIDGQPQSIRLQAFKAYEQAIANFIAKPELLELVAPKPKVRTIKVDKQPPVSSAPSAESGGLLSQVANKLQFSAVKKANAAKALSLVNPLRIMIAQYYAENGQWPARFADLDLNPADLREKDVIDDVELRLGGVLHVRLAHSTFGENEIMQLIPRETMGGQSLAWDCRTSLDKNYWVGGCQGQ
ncbi:MAG TPA: DUF4124 domain-containing protein [Cellvibrio sp.]